MSHTPGPLKLWTNDKGAFVISTETGDAVLCQRGDWEHYAEQSRANGYLYHAAPELLAGLESMVRWAEKNVSGFDRSEWADVYAALAKAAPPTGKSDR